MATETATSFAKTRAAAGAPIDAVIENLPINANGYFMTEDQMASIEAALSVNEDAAATLATAQADLQTANATLETNNQQINQLTDQLTTAQARITELEAMGGNASTTTTDADKPADASTVIDVNQMDWQKELYEKAK